MQLMRILLDSDGEPISFDLFVDGHGRVSDNVATYGRWGSLTGADIWPFVLRPTKGSGEALMDFGATEGEPSDPAERYARTNIVSKRIQRGELATVWYGGDEYCCKIATVKRMPDGADFSPEPST